MGQELLNTTTTYADITRENARYLAKSIGGFTRFAEKVGTADTQVSQILGKNSIRNIGSKLARRIETAFEKPIGWLDRPQGESDPGEFSGASHVVVLSAELDAMRDRADKSSACLRASLSAPEMDKNNLLKLVLSLLKEK